MPSLLFKFNFFVVGAHQIIRPHHGFCLVPWMSHLTVLREARTLPGFLTPLCLISYLACPSDPLLCPWSFISFCVLLITWAQLYKSCLLLYPLDLIFITPAHMPDYIFLLVWHLYVPPVFSGCILELSPFPPACLHSTLPLWSWPNWLYTYNMADSHQKLR